jgi:hypothetical protein
MLPADVRVEPEAHWQPMAEAVGRVGWHSHRAGHREDVWNLVPRYYRQSAAEEKRARRDDERPS